MEIKEGIVVKTLVEKTFVEFLDKHILIKKGAIGVVCDTYHLKEGFVSVEFSDPLILDNGSGVYDYDLSELEITNS